MHGVAVHEMKRVAFRCGKIYKSPLSAKKRKRRGFCAFEAQFPMQLLLNYKIYEDMNIYSYLHITYSYHFRLGGVGYFWFLITSFSRRATSAYIIAASTQRINTALITRSSLNT